MLKALLKKSKIIVLAASVALLSISIPAFGANLTKTSEIVEDDVLNEDDDIASASNIAKNSSIQEDYSETALSEAKLSAVVKPTINNPKIIYDSWDTISYYVCADIETGTYPLSAVKFCSWTETNGQDDVVWTEDPNISLREGKSGSYGSTIYDCEHNYEKGVYHTDIYAYDTQGNCTVYKGLSITLKNEGKVLSEYSWNGHIYRYYSDNLTWNQAKIACEAAGGHLATITSKEENTIVTDLLPSSVLNRNKRARAYLGGKVVDKKIQWITGESSNYTNWGEGQPDNYNNSEDVVIAYIPGDEGMLVYEGLANIEYCDDFDYMDTCVWNDYISNSKACGYILEIDPKTEIVTQPVDRSGSLGSTVFFTVRATGTNLSYRWQVSTNGGVYWTDSQASGNKTASLSVKVQESSIGNKYRCVVMGSNGGAVSNAATLTSSISAPELISVISGNTGVTFKWKPVNGITKYRIYRKTGSGAFGKLKDVKGASIVDTAVVSGEQYTYTVSCLSSDGKKELSGKDNTGKKITWIETPVVNVPTSAKAGVRVSWPAVQGASKYVIFRHVGPGQPTWKWLKSVSASADETMSFIDSSPDVTSGTWYAYTIRAIASDGTYSGQVGGRSIKYLAPVEVNKVQSISTGVRVTFTNVNGGYTYRLYRSTKGSNGKFGDYVKIVDQTKIWNGNPETVWIHDPTAKKGTTYRYYVRCVSKDGAVPLSSYKNYMEITYK